MPSEESRHRKGPKEYSILIVPSRERGKTRNFRITALKFWLACGVVFVFIITLMIAALKYTSLPAYVSIPNPELERKYGREIVETQRQLKSLADDVMILRDYNSQLRRALGQESGSDTVSSAKTFSSAVTNQNKSIPSMADIMVEAGGEDSVQSTESYGDYETGGTPFNAVVTNMEGFRAAFPLLQPTQGYMAQGFDPVRKHYGIDYAAKQGTPVYAAAEGYIMFSTWTYEDGNIIVIAHGGGYSTIYKHNQSLLKAANTFVKRGELIGLVGNSGKTSLGTHLHFELWKDGIPQDPNEFLLGSAIIQ